MLRHQLEGENGIWVLRVYRAALGLSDARMLSKQAEQVLADEGEHASRALDDLEVRLAGRWKQNWVGGSRPGGVGTDDPARRARDTR